LRVFITRRLELCVHAFHVRVFALSQRAKLWRSRRILERIFTAIEAESDEAVVSRRADIQCKKLGVRPPAYGGTPEKYPDRVPLCANFEVIAKAQAGK
jgi:hypothetical protein